MDTKPCRLRISTNMQIFHDFLLNIRINSLVGSIQWRTAEYYLSKIIFDIKKKWYVIFVFLLITIFILQLFQILFRWSGQDKSLKTSHLLNVFLLPNLRVINTSHIIIWYIIIYLTSVYSGGYMVVIFHVYFRHYLSYHNLFN